MVCTNITAIFALRYVRIGSKFGQIGPYGTNLELKRIFKSPIFVPFGADLTRFGANLAIPDYSGHVTPTQGW